MKAKYKVYERGADFSFDAFSVDQERSPRPGDSVNLKVNPKPRIRGAAPPPWPVGSTIKAVVQKRTEISDQYSTVVYYDCEGPLAEEHLESQIVRYMGESYETKYIAHTAAYYTILEIPFTYTFGEGFFLPETLSETGEKGLKVPSDHIIPNEHSRTVYCSNCGTSWENGPDAVCPTCGTPHPNDNPVEAAAKKRSGAADIDFSYCYASDILQINQHNDQ